MADVAIGSRAAPAAGTAATTTGDRATVGRDARVGGIAAITTMTARAVRAPGAAPPILGRRLPPAIPDAPTAATVAPADPEDGAAVMAIPTARVAHGPAVAPEVPLRRLPRAIPVVPIAGRAAPAAGTAAMAMAAAPTAARAPGGRARLRSRVRRPQRDLLPLCARHHARHARRRSPIVKAASAIIRKLDRRAADLSRPPKRPSRRQGRRQR